MIEYAIGHFEAEVKAKKTRFKSCKKCGELCHVSKRKCETCGFYFYELKGVIAPKKHYEINWEDARSRETVYVLSCDFWRSPDGENVGMSDSGEYLIIKVTSQGILAYNKHGYIFFDMINEGYNPKTGITRGKTRIFKRGRNPQS